VCGSEEQRDRGTEGQRNRETKTGTEGQKDRGSKAYRIRKEVRDRIRGIELEVYRGTEGRTLEITAGALRCLCTRCWGRKISVAPRVRPFSGSWFINTMRSLDNRCVECVRTPWIKPARGGEV
jgi:hypothetical protein